MLVNIKREICCHIIQDLKFSIEMGVNIDCDKKVAEKGVKNVKIYANFYFFNEYDFL